MEALIDQFGEGTLLLMTGAVVGLVFGAFAFHSRFCLRAATAEVAGGKFGISLSIWLVAFLAALVSVQGAIAFDVLDVSQARQLAATGSLSGAIIGGLLFGCGMILARGCASRLLVLSATGNLRAIVTGLVLTLTAQASLRGILSPFREMLAGIWTIQGGEARSLLATLGISQTIWLVAGIAALLGAFAFGVRHKARASIMISAAMVGLTICAGWVGTYLIAQNSFEVIAVQSVTFTGPSTDTLMALVNERDISVSFGLGLVPGVFLGALAIAMLRGEARIQRFEPDTPMERYLIGGMLMGFGSMLAGGCAVGAGVTGGAILAVTAWVAVGAMWVGAVSTQIILNQKVVGEPTGY